MGAAVIMTFLPLLGAGAVLLAAARPPAAKALGLLVTGATLLTALFNGLDTAPSRYAVLLTAAAYLALLGQPAARRSLFPLVMTLVLLGLGLGSLHSGQRLAVLLLAALLVLVAAAVAGYGRAAGAAHAGTGAVAVLFGLGAAALTISAALPERYEVLGLVGLMAMLPLFPLQRPFVGALAILPGTLAAFLTVLLPVLGWHRLGWLGSLVSGSTQALIVILAAAGAALALLRAAVQADLAETLCYLGTALLAVAWWALGTGVAPSVTALFVIAISLVLFGLLLASHHVVSRHGPLDLVRVGGLARPLPRFAVLMTILIMAAVGLPLFAPFSGFVAIVLGSSGAGWGHWLVLFAMWALTSCLLIRLLQRLLFGPARLERPVRDLSAADAMPVAAILLLLAGLAFFPSAFDDDRPLGFADGDGRIPEQASVLTSAEP